MSHLSAISWDLEAKELLGNNAAIVGVVVLSVEGGGGARVIAMQGGPSSSMTDQEAHAFGVQELSGELHRQVLRVAGRDYAVTTVTRATMYARGISQGAGALVICRFPRHLVLLVTSANRFIPTAFCEQWSNGILTIMNAAL